MLPLRTPRWRRAEPDDQVVDVNELGVRTGRAVAAQVHAAAVVVAECREGHTDDDSAGRGGGQ